ncbi:MAG: hypothetical protein HN353_04775 [Bdellovibrionales bacterium]|nr:hypothetical protein [Bdellovibrionales bacterium]MBT3527400.1 hypothetical protein [Bdellovibrionales bacterium]MBT7669689.1 hypothetical protein [Bdellovibrionales bacterium]MBT7765653.1 hypothetical protein [Bdellovibrionales bacterium]
MIEVNLNLWVLTIFICLIVSACSTPYRLGRSKYCSDRVIRDGDHCEQEYQKHLKEAMGLNPNLD